jgi:hypothetical protein
LIGSRTNWQHKPSRKVLGLSRSDIFPDEAMSRPYLNATQPTIHAKDLSGAPDLDIVE